MQIRVFTSEASLSYIGTVQNGSILQNHQTHHRGNHHHQRDRIETRTTHPHNKRAMQKQRNRMSSNMENSAKEECNKPHNQMSRRTLHVEYKIEAPHHQAIYKDRHHGDSTQQTHQRMTQEEETKTTKEKDTATKFCNIETKKLF
jgi:hypothetical protein